ncbi:MAG: hypothetical protein EAZ08_10170, partial [Cytophagales bacterium]
MKHTILFVLYFCYLSGFLYAQKTTVLNTKQTYFPLQNEQVWAFEDAEHQISFEQIRKISDQKFYVPNRYYTNFGITSSAFWVKFKVLNTTQEKSFLRLVNPVLDTAELYVVANNKLIMQKTVLARKPEMDVPNSPFLLPSSPDTLTCYLRASSRVPLWLQMYILPEAHASSFVFWQSALDILFFGGILIMILYNLFLGITTRNLSYFYYVSYSFFLVITTFFIKGYPVPLMGKYAFLIDDYFAVYVSLASICLALFTQNFLQLGTQYRTGKKLLDISIGLQILVIIIFLLGFVNLNVFLYQIVNVFGNILVAWSAFYLYKKKDYKPALLFLIAFLLYLVLLNAVNLTFANLLPATIFTLYFFHIGSTAELVIFSVALGDKINLYRKETLKAQAENLKLIQEQNVVLEQKVGERTYELNQTNEELNTTLHTVAKQRDDIVSSINYALRIQNAIIPKESELQKHLDCFVFFRPRDIVSGDFYFFADKGNQKIIAVADCTGHGVSGAFMTMIGNNILNQIVHDQEIYEPNQILNLMPALLEKTLSHSEGKVKDGMDISIVSLENLSPLPESSQTTKITYAGAMNSLYYVQNQELIEVKANKKPIDTNFDENFSYQKHEILLSKKTMLYLLSDGFQDQFGGTENRKFM